MDISSRKSLLLNISKQAVLSDEERVDRLKKMRDGLSGLGADPQGGGPQMNYSEEQRQLLLGYKDLLDNWNSYGEYINQPMKEIGDWVMEKTVTPIVNAIGGVEEVAKEHDVPGAGKEVSDADRQEALEEIKSFTEEYMRKNSLSLTSPTSHLDELNKIASTKNNLLYVSNIFNKELEKSFDLVQVKLAAECEDIDQEDFDKYYELALAHHILLEEGLYKEAKQIDNFVLYNIALDEASLSKVAGLGDWLSDRWEDTKNVASKAWEGTKKVVKKTVKYIGKAAVAVGKGVAKGFKWIAKMAAKGLKYLASKLPVLGILFSLPFFIKNIIEAYHNGKDLFWDDKHNMTELGFDKWKCITPLGSDHVVDTYRSQIEEHKRDPDKLKRLITIFRTIGAFWIDALFAITNGFMAILDLIAIAGLFFPGPGWLVSIGALGANWLIGIGVASLEISSEYFKDHYWKKEEKRLWDLIISESEKVRGEGTPVEVNEEDMFVIKDLPVASAPASTSPSSNSQPPPSNAPSNPDVIETSESQPLAA